MEISCPECEQSISYVGEPPRFCQHCGLALETAVVAAAATTAAVDVTVPPSTKAALPEKPAGTGDIVGPYRLERWLGSGGMGVVWEAVETKTGRRVALKRLAKSMTSDETYVKRFLREARLVAQISHPQVTFIYGAGSEDDQPYIAMELMPGNTLEDKVKQDGPLTVPVAVDSILDVVEGLIAAHRLGMIHRDVKPANCFLDSDDSVKIGDFGLSKSLLSNDVNLTQTGTFMGTPSYAAPEQVRGGDLDERTDVYSVGATLYYLLTARTPFKGDAMSITAQIITDKPPSVREFSAETPKDLDRVIAKCLEKDPAKRFQDLDELKIALMPFATQRESIAEIGRRLAAYMIDQCLIQIVFFTLIIIWTFGLMIYWQVTENFPPGGNELQDKLNQELPFMTFWGGTVTWLGTMLYYAILEGKFGRALGKRLMGLRVVNREGQRPGFWRAWLCAFVVPGCVGIPWAFTIWQSNFGEMPVSATDQLLNFLRGTLVTVVPVLIFSSTMRVSNGLLGIQGMLSGTRVVRLNTGNQTIRVPVTQPACDTIESMRFGPYETRELLGESQFGKIFIGFDAPLNRNVWIVQAKNGTAPSPARINLARVSRQRWIDGGELDDGTRWDAFEAIQGAPVQTYVGIQNGADWTHYRQIKTDVVDELRQALEDGTLPETLSLPQIWLDEDGHAKLLDKQLVNVVESNGSARIDHPIAEPAETGSVERAVWLVQQLGDLFRRTQVLPSSVQDFLIELEQRPGDETTLVWASEQLKQLSKNIGGLAWDSRLGILGVTMGIELVINILVAGCIFLFCFYVAPIPNEYRFFWGIAGGLCLPVTLTPYFVAVSYSTLWVSRFAILGVVRPKN